ncbi:hypothetical protein [Streptomyces sp. NPDC049906]|uniref:hypothetical protein n=1 Tax=Streptomyces sp. NPDC049906 TaxID=3155656 RepID=UPI003416D74E
MAVVLPFGVPGYRRADLAGADVGPVPWEEGGKHSLGDDADADGANVRGRGKTDDLDDEVAGSENPLNTRHFAFL